MKRFLSLSILIVSLTCFSQSLVTSDFMYQLPRTADDFQNYQFDYPLENGMDVKSSYYMDSDFSAFDVVEIYPFELQERTKVKSILYAVYQKNNFLAMYGKATYNSKGQLTNYDSKNKISENYVFGFDKWNEIRGVSRELTNCVPNSFTYQTRPTRNSKGLITNVESELTYTYDSKDRVVEVNLRDGLFSYRYEYVGESKHIRKITVYNSGRLRADAIYGYSNNLIISVDCHQYMSSGREGSIESEYHKTYEYDSHNNISEINFHKEAIGGSGKNIQYKFHNEYDSKGKVLESRISRMRTQHVGNYTSGSDKAPTDFVRKYTYDEHGNWIKIEDDEGYIQRIIEYRAIGNGGENDIYDEEEVTVNATFGQTFVDLFKRKGNILYPVSLEESGKRIDTSINASFTVEKDGSLSNFDIQNNSSERERFINNTKYQIEKLHWLPATINGKPVRCNVSVNFRIENFEVIVTKDIKYTSAEYKAYTERKNDKIGNPTNSFSEMLELYKQNPENEQLYASITDTYIQKGMNVEVINLADERIAKYPDSSLPHVYKGFLLMQDNKFDEAIAEYDKVKEDNSLIYLNSIVNRAVCKYNKAVKFTEANADPSTGKMTTANNKKFMTMLKDAQGDFEKAKMLDPEQKAVQWKSLLLNIYTVTGQTDKAAALK